MSKRDEKLIKIGPELGIRQVGVPCGLLQPRTEPGYVLEDGTALLEIERDAFGRYKGGAGMDGMYLQTGRLYTPLFDSDGQIRAFQEVRTEDPTITETAPQKDPEAIDAAAQRMTAQAVAAAHEQAVDLEG